MTEYLSDKEQAEMLKRWWRDYGKFIAIAVAIGLIIGFGWRYYSREKIQKSEQASLIFQAMSLANVQKQYGQAQAFAKQLTSQYQSTPYATIANLLWAREAIEKNQLAVALKKLQWVVKNSKIASFKQIARIRAARVLLAQKKPQQALAMLKVVDESAYQSLIDGVKGDIYHAMGKLKQADQFYQKAKVGMSAIGAQSPILEMKLAQ